MIQLLNSQNKSFLGSAACIACSILAVYAFTIVFPFQFDDIYYVQTTAGLSSVQDYLYKVSLIPPRILTFSTFALNDISGLGVPGYRVVNIFIHIVTAVLLLGVLRQLSLSSLPSESNSSRTACLIVAMFFALHPIQTETITMVWQRCAALAGMFCVAALYFHSRYRLDPRSDTDTRWRILTFTSLLLAALSKENGTVAVGCLLLIDLIFFKINLATLRREWRLWIFYCAPLVATAMLTLLVKHQVVDDFIQADHTSPLDYFRTQLRVLWIYFSLIAAPFRLNVDWHYPFVSGPLNLSDVFLLVSVITPIAAALVLRKSRPWESAGALFFAIAASVECGFITLLDALAEHRMYLPSIGLSFLLFPSVNDLVRKKGRLAQILLFLVLIVFAGGTVSRNLVWRDPVTLWTDTVEKTPNQARPLNNLAVAYLEAGFPETALPILERAVKSESRSIKTTTNLIEILSQIGRAEEAWLVAKRERSRLEKHPLGLLHIASAARISGRNAEARHYYQKAKSMDPTLVEAKVWLARFLIEDGRTSEALNVFDDADLSDFMAVEIATEILHKVGRDSDAEKVAIKAVSRFPVAGQPYHALGKIFQRNSAFDEAKDAFAMAVKQGYLPAVASAIRLALEQGDVKEADGMFTDALTIRELPLWIEIADIYSESGKDAMAARALAHCISMSLDLKRPGLDIGNLYYNLAIIQARQKQYEQAAISAETAEQLGYILPAGMLIDFRKRAGKTEIQGTLKL